MEYSILRLAKMSGVTTRTLRYYDEIGLLKPLRVNSSGYRIYGQKQVDLLVQILFYRELDVSLEEIRKIVTDPAFNTEQALRQHHENLLQKRARIDALIAGVEKSLACVKGEIPMSDAEKFEGFKQKLIKENEAKYGKEIREKYGDTAVEQSNRKVKNMTEEEYKQITALEKQLFEALLEGYKTGNPASEAAQKAADLHRQWLSFYWGSYSKQAHAGVARMYVEDPRFTAYYDKYQPGLTTFLRDAVLIYTKEDKM